MTNNINKTKNEEVDLYEANNLINKAYDILSGVTDSYWGQKQICDNRDEKSYALGNLNDVSRKISNILKGVQ